MHLKFMLMSIEAPNKAIKNRSALLHWTRHTPRLLWRRYKQEVYVGILETQ